MHTELSFSQLKHNKFGDQYFTEVNHLTFASIPAETLFKRDYDSLFEREEFLYIVVGTDSGLFVEFIRQQTLPKNMRFIFIEHQAVIDASPYLGEETRQGVIWVVNQGFKFSNLLPEFNGYLIRRKVLLVKSFSVLDAENNSPYALLWRQIDGAFTSFINSEFNAQSTKVFEVERIYNAGHNIVPVIALDKTLEGRDAVIVGGGPTLDESIEWIRANQSKLIIFAAARVAKRMAMEDIVPDFFVSVDPFPWSFDNSKSVLSFSEQSIFVTSFHAQHRLVSQWSGDHVYAGERYAWKHNKARENINAPGPTVTNAALHIAVSIGAKRVFLAGIDFCFAGGRTHESKSQEAQMNDIHRYITKHTLEDNLGNMTETDTAFYSSKQAMESAIEVYLAHKPLSFFSLGSGSAKMKNVTYKPAIEFSDTLIDKTDAMLNIREIIRQNMEQASYLVDETLVEFKAQLKRFSQLHDHSVKALQIIPKLYDKKTLGLKAKAGIRVSRLRNKVNTLIDQDGDMLMNYQAAFFADSFKPVEDEANMTPEEVVEQLTAFFKGVKKASNDFESALKKGLERIKLRRDELGLAVQPCDLVGRWIDESEPGRSLLWIKSRDMNLINDANKACLDNVKTLFEEEFSKTDHQYKDRLKAKLSNVATMYHRANEAYLSANSTEIENLILHVTELDAVKTEQKTSFLIFLKAMHEELVGDSEDAIDMYLQVEMPFFRKISLQKVLDIKMRQQKYEEALLVLEALCGYSLDFMIPYAEMLNLLGNQPAAIEVLGMYINQKPKAIDARLKLAQWQLDANQTSEARQVLNQVIEINPENKAALHLLARI